MANYAELKKLDEETLLKMKEGKGPAEECLCTVLSPPVNEKRGGIRKSIKKAFTSLGKGKRDDEYIFTKAARKRRKYEGRNSVDIPIIITKGGKGIYTTKEVVKRSSPCGKCGCDDEKFVLKHSFANIKITAPDISSVCPCDADCLPGSARDKLQNNIKVTVENVQLIKPDSTSNSSNDSSECNSVEERQFAELKIREEDSNDFVLSSDED